MTLKEYRKLHNLSQTALAKQVGVSISTISKLESGTYHSGAGNVSKKIKNIVGEDVEIITLEENCKYKQMFLEAKERIEELENKIIELNDTIEKCVVVFENINEIKKLINNESSFYKIIHKKKKYKGRE